MFAWSLPIVGTGEEADALNGLQGSDGVGVALVGVNAFAIAPQLDRFIGRRCDEAAKTADREHATRRCKQMALLGRAWVISLPVSTSVAERASTAHTAWVCPRSSCTHSAPRHTRAVKSLFPSWKTRHDTTRHD